MTDLTTLSMTDLVVRHNGVVETLNRQYGGDRKVAGPKTFSTRTKAIVRIRALEAELEVFEAAYREHVVEASPGPMEDLAVKPADEPEAVVEPEAAESSDEPIARTAEPAAVEQGVQETAVEAPVAKSPNGRVHIIRTLSEELLLQTSPALSYEDVLAEVKRYFPKGSTTIACLRWYAVQLRERGERVPNRPRAPRKPAEKAEG